MQFPESWLREFCNPPLTTEQIADTLTMAGLEVEDLRPVAPPFTGVVVGEIREAVQHPNADRLRVCQVDVGAAALLNIVCGAPNARPGIRVPCALVGAELPPGDDGKPFSIKLGKLRGVESQGMLCSARELKLSDDHQGLLELDGSAPIGANLREVLQLDDTVFTLKLTPNLAHCLSVFGVARELAALTGAPLNTPRWPQVKVSHDERRAVHVAAPDLCGRFSGRVVKGVNPQASTPRWMVERLARCGQRSVNALVDISNYVMFELGRPSHIFDLDKLHGALQVRWGRPGETLKLLNGATVEVDERVGVIADDVQVESLAGIMGGDATAVSDATVNIYVEAAFWWPQAIAGRSRRFNFSTDAGHRFERGVDPQHTVEHIERITQLVLDICGGEAGPIDDQQPNMPVQPPVALRVDRAAKVLGMPVSAAECVRALRALGLEVHEDAGVVTVQPPSFRFDLRIEEDLIEEIARVIGYDRLPNTPPIAPITPKLQPEAARTPFALRHALADLGYHETINFSFVDERWEREVAGNTSPIRLLNPIASHLSVMRSSLLASLLQVIKFNVDRKADRVRVFEIGRVFLRDASVEDTDATVAGLWQPMRVAAAAYGPALPLHWASKSAPVDFFDLKGDLEQLLAPAHPRFVAAEHPAMHPGRCAQVFVGERAAGFVGELHPRLRQRWDLPRAPILFELDLDRVLERRIPSFQDVSRFPAVHRDVALVVAEQVSYEQVMGSIWKAPYGGILRDAVLFDIYRPQLTPGGEVTGPVAVGEKSLAVRLTLGSDQETLSDAQIESAVRAVVEQAAADFGARLRS